MSWRTTQHCETEYGEYEPYTIRHLRICSDVFLLTMLVIVADADKVFPICNFREAYLKKTKIAICIQICVCKFSKFALLFISSD